MEVHFSTHDLLCVRSAYNITDNPEYYYKGKFGSAQYSESYAQWIIHSVNEDRAFFESARLKYRGSRP
jgi:hypothetical protein